MALYKCSFRLLDGVFWGIGTLGCDTRDVNLPKYYLILCMYMHGWWDGSTVNVLMSCNCTCHNWYGCGILRQSRIIQIWCLQLQGYTITVAGTTVITLLDETYLLLCFWLRATDDSWWLISDLQLWFCYLILFFHFKLKLVQCHVTAYQVLSYYISNIGGGNRGAPGAHAPQPNLLEVGVSAPLPKPCLSIVY